VREGVIEVIRDGLVPLADVLTPNDFEFDLLAGTPCRAAADFLPAAAAFAGAPKRIVATGCVLLDTPAGKLENIALEGGRLMRVPTPRIDTRSVGTGDLFTAILTAGLATGRDFEGAVRLATTTLARVLEHTVAAGEPHMQLGSAMAELLTLRDAR
jgi:pyridoxine kinase